MNGFPADGIHPDSVCIRWHVRDVAIHDTDGHNPHAHIMTTLRPLNPDGTWQHKTEKEYICIRNGEERGFTAAEFKEARNDGWQKQYPYLVGKKKVYMPAAEGEAHGYERASKYAKTRNTDGRIQLLPDGTVKNSYKNGVLPGKILSIIIWNAPGVKNGLIIAVMRNAVWTKSLQSMRVLLPGSWRKR